ncbi:hypothetical protein DVA67_006785 [Solirubrobacter sp. CPCC 204708]|uniref:DUF4190 domain-containing protein n=1 Tax=Solirubrobacter deserti TaxID=2282478 RepID=A0ABT4RT40_9ACTN|nr:hypothetical protein [Solirubrobacter deserti]MBE2315673.1 hypothetical protein [Solirubrobacter deserti]MDA0141749.1 hypothetical protein [Solirubrobacter deserti]
MIFAELIAWGDLGKVVLVGLAGGVGLVVTWGLLLLGLERTQEVRSGARSGGLAAYGAIALVGGLCTLALLVLGLWALTQK